MSQLAREFEVRTPKAKISTARAPELPRMNHWLVVGAISPRLKPEHLPSFTEYAAASYEGGGVWRVDFGLYGQTASWYVSDEMAEVQPQNDVAREFEQHDLSAAADVPG